MNPIKKSATLSAGIGMLLWVGSVTAAWTLNNDASRLSFVSIKKEQVAEVHTFTHLSGEVDDQGKVAVTIQLASVDTAVAIRDERMRDMLFKTDLFPKATVTGEVDVAKYQKLATGQTSKDEIELTLSLHGESQPLKAEVAAVKLAGGQLMVTTIPPIIVNAGDFDLTKGVEELRKIAGLPAISSAVPVTLNLVFDPAK